MIVLNPFVITSKNQIGIANQDLVVVGENKREIIKNILGNTNNN